MSASQPPVPPVPASPGAGPEPRPPYPAAPPPVPPAPVSPAPGQAYPPYPAPPSLPAAPTPPYAATPGPPAAPYAAPYTPPVHPQYGAALAAAPPRGSATTGIVAVVVAGLAALTPILAAVAAFQIGLGVGHTIVVQTPSTSFDVHVLSPVRGWVLLAEIAFWAGTALGLWAIVQGIVAIATRRGRGAGIVALAIAVLAPICFFVVLWLSLAAGAGTSVAG